MKSYGNIEVLPCSEAAYCSCEEPSVLFLLVTVGGFGQGYPQQFVQITPIGSHLEMLWVQHIRVAPKPLQQGRGSPCESWQKIELKLGITNGPTEGKLEEMGTDF